MFVRGSHLPLRHLYLFFISAYADPGFERPETIGFSE
jgi:hypothetical protein